MSWVLKSLSVAALLASQWAAADHQPRSYSFDAKRGVYHSPRVASFIADGPPSPLPAAAAPSPDIAARLDDVLLGEPAVALAALALDRGEVVYERYAAGEADNLYPSWSMSKSITSLVMGYALCEGLVGSVDDRAEQYAPQLKGTVWGQAKIRDLLTMSSGASKQSLDAVDGDYRLASGGGVGHAVSRHRMSLQDVFRRFVDVPPGAEPGRSFSYNNLDTEALAAVIAGASGVKFQDYFQRTLWKQVGAEHKAVWYLDSQGDAIAHAYFFASVRDFARLARHLIDLYKGRSGSPCLQSYVKEALTPRIHAGGTSWYGYQFWMRGLRSGPIAAMMGHQGQIIYFNYEAERVIVVTAFHSSIRQKYSDPGKLIPWLRGRSPS